MKCYNTITLILLLAMVAFAQNLYIETLDEQRTSNNLLVLRFRIINNTTVTLRDASLKYCLTKSPNKVVDVERYYVGNSQISLENIDSTNACFSVKMDSIPHGIYPNQSGYSIGVHYRDWSPRNKTLDFSNPQSSTFSRADNVALYIDETLLYGSDYQVANDSDAYLPEPTPLSAFDGISVVLGPNEPYRFVWNHVDEAERYLLTVLRDDSTLVHSAEYPTNVADVLLPTGHYLWNVQAINSDKPARSFFSFFYRMHILDTRPGLQGYRIGGPTDTIVSSDGRKDTRLLNISWGELADLRKWDTVHAPLDPVTRPLDEEEGERCWAIAIQNLNHYYRMANGERGNLTLDEIVALGHMYEAAKSFYDTATTSFPLKYEDWREKIKNVGGPAVSASSPAIAAFPLNWGGYPYVQSYMLSWALNIPRPKEYLTNEEFQGSQNLIAQLWVDSLSDGKPIVVNQCFMKRDKCDPTLWKYKHTMLIDGFRYRSADTIEFHFINIDNYGVNEWRILLGENWHFIYSFTIINDVDTVRATLPEVHVDSDTDGVMDFDELYRFESDYRLRDTDHDGIEDKTEIYSYVIRERIKGGRDVYHPGMITGSGVKNEIFADIDKDRKRAENDDDSDGDSIKDGDEDLNHNGILDSGETDPYHNDNTDSTINEIPENIIIYSFDYIRINDNVHLFKGTSERSQCGDNCDIAAETKENISVNVGARAKIGDVYTKGPVWVRNMGIVRTVRYYGLPQIFGTILTTVPNDGDFYKEQLDINLDERLWPYHIPEFFAKSINTNTEKIVRAGECDTLAGVVSFKTIKVEAGGKLYFDEGEISVKNLQLDAGSSIDFVKPGFSTILHVNEHIQWNTVIENRNFDAVAEGFKLYYYGSEQFFVHGVWAGTLIAPNAKLVLGQTENKKIYGQFLGKGVTVHQFSKIFRVSYKSRKSITSNAQLNVAWLGVLK
ncbi:hypothetical protein IKQ19_10900 [Candidatus Saccharibacteria bacterium]|nr:hypothetical protein [Candidatus Saccharibacteria bacterium]